MTPGPRSVDAMEVYADIWCPFAYVGLRWVTAHMRELGRDDASLVIRAWPLELVNGKPQDAAATSAHVEELRAQVAGNLFAGFDASRFPRSTLDALALAAAAYRRDRASGTSVSLELRDLMFEQGVDISDDRVLSDVAARHGLSRSEDDRRAVLDEWHRGQDRGVLGSPHFFCGDVNAFCPALDISRDEAGAAEMRERMDRMRAFVDQCFGRSAA